MVWLVCLMRMIERGIYSHFIWHTVKSIYNFTHTRGIFSIAPCNFSHGKTKNYAWHDELPRVEKGFTTPRNCHAWRSKPLPHVANIKTMSRAVTCVEETHCIHCFEAHLYRIINTKKLPRVAVKAIATPG